MTDDSRLTTLFTIGHSNRTFDELLDILRAHGIEQLIDVRTAPGSRRNPQFLRDELARSLPERGIAYTHMPALGGFRKPLPESPNAAWRNESFRGYADYMQTAQFEETLQELLVRAATRPTVIMCSEAVPWRCHRSLIADAATVRGVRVEHLTSRTASHPHKLTPFAQVEGTRITYPPVHTFSPSPRSGRGGWGVRGRLP
jgi:uncharacterized protein (DUF488 family)